MGALLISEETFLIIPSNKVSNTVVDPYNVVLNFHQFVGNAEQCGLCWAFSDGEPGVALRLGDEADDTSARLRSATCLLLWTGVMIDVWTRRFD